MDTFLIVVAVIAVAWFVLPRVSKRRRDAEDDALARGGFWGMGMLSWLPAWMILGGMTHHDAGANIDAGANSHDAGGGWGGGGDSGNIGGGGDLGGGFGGN